VTRIATYRRYLDYAEERREEHLRRKLTERNLIAKESSFTVSGWCFVCRQNTRFEVNFSYAYAVGGQLTPNWREHLRCPNCGLNNRMRAAIHILEQECALQPAHSIYITEQTTPLFQVVRHRYRNLSASEYLGATLPFGTTDSDGVRNESVTRLTFSSNAFDHILCFDVFEHVPNPAKGFAECLRCLRPGGSLLFSVPFTGNPVTIVRARENPDRTVEHLLPPEYHGDPRNAMGCLCFYHFGWDLLDTVRNLGFRETAGLFYWSREFGYLGNGDQVIFTAQKPR
jgi:SAM-dependent methyltransferase